MCPTLESIDKWRKRHEVWFAHVVDLSLRNGDELTGESMPVLDNWEPRLTNRVEKNEGQNIGKGRVRPMIPVE